MSQAIHPAGQQDADFGGPPRARRWLVLILLAFAQFMLILDVTVVNVALPSIQTELDLERETLTWVVAAYALAFGGLMLLGGRLADAFGARRTLLIGLAIFTVASLAAGLSGNGALLVAGRVAQGIGAALLSPSALSTITTTFHGHERNRALGVWAAIGGAGSALGVLIGGLLTAGPGWRWVFFINVPVGIAVFLLLPVLIAGTTPSDSVERQVDVPGAIAVTVGTGLLVVGLLRAGEAGWASAWTLVPIGLSALAYTAFAVIERRVRIPLVRLGLLAQRPVVSGTFVMLVASSLMLAFFFLSSLYAQQVLGLGALQTGLLFLPVAIAVTAGAQLGSHLIGRIGGKPIGFAGFVIVAIGAGMLTQVSERADAYTTLLPGFLIAAFGLGPLFVTATSTTLANVSHQHAGLASGVINTFHELGGAIGVAVVSTVAAGSIAEGSTNASGFATAFLVAAVAAAVSAVISFAVLPPGKVAGVVGHGH